MMARDGARRGERGRCHYFRTVWLILAIVGWAVVGPVEPRAHGQQSRAGTPTGSRAPVSKYVTSLRGTTRTSADELAALPGDDVTLRPTVIVRRGTAQGSGTIIASVDGDCLVLTAAHVVKSQGPIWVEMHRFNIGRERIKTTSGTWPRLVPATLAAADSAADLAILRLRALGELPFVARLAPDQTQPAPDSAVNSVGIDLGKKLTTWTTRVVETVWFELDKSEEPRPFLITVHTPEHGRSGGGLFLSNGELVGVCVGHAPLVKGKRMGVFASAQSIRRLLEDHDLKGLLARSEKRQAFLINRSRATRKTSEQPDTNPVVTPTRSITLGADPSPN